jgi:hypothetical protein
MVAIMICKAPVGVVELCLQCALAAGLHFVSPSFSGVLRRPRLKLQVLSMNAGQEGDYNHNALEGPQWVAFP